MCYGKSLVLCSIKILCDYRFDLQNYLPAQKRNNYKFEQSNIIISTYRVREQPTTLLRASQVNVDE